MNQFDALTSSDIDWVFSAIYSIRDWIVALITIGGTGFGVYRSRARVKGDGKSVLRYIDYMTDQLVEEIEYSFRWGYLYSGSVPLPRLPRDSTFKIFYKPRISHKQELPHDNYEDKAKGSHRHIKLCGKDFFDEAECNCVYVLTSLAQDVKYKPKIQPSKTQDGIVVVNHNMEEIRNYPIELPQDIDLTEISDMFSRIESFDTSKKTGNTGGIIIVLKPIPPEQGTTPGKAFIPIRKVKNTPS